MSQDNVVAAFLKANKIKGQQVQLDALVGQVQRRAIKFLIFLNLKLFRGYQH